MKISGASIVSIFALLFAGVMEGCPTLKARGKKYVVGGKSTYYKVCISTGTTAVAYAALTITLPGGVDFDSSSTWPKRGAPSQSGADLTWTGLSLAARKRYTFRVKMVVDACTPNELDFEANVSGGSCDVDAATVTTMVKRAKGAEPCPTGACTAAGLTVNGKAVYSCGNYNICGGAIISQSSSSPEDCVEACESFWGNTGFFAAYKASTTACACSLAVEFAAFGVIPDALFVGYTIGENPDTLNSADECPIPPPRPDP